MKTSVHEKLFAPMLLILSVMLLSSVASTGSAQAKDPPKPTVTVAEATMKTVTQTDTYLGRIEAIDTVDIIARVAGFVDKINFTDGTTVKAQDVLIEIEPDTYQANIKEIQGQIESANAAQKLAEIETDRQQKLYDKGDVAQAVLQRAQAQQGQADGLVTQLQGSLDDAQIQLSYTKIIAPFDGRIGLTRISKGAFVEPQSGTLLTLTSVDPIYVTFPVSNAQLLDFQKRGEDLESKEVSLQLTLANGDVYGQAGHVETLDSSVQQSTDTVLVRGVFPNPDGALLNGQLTRVAVIDTPDAQVLTIPASALQSDQQGYFVLTVGADGTVAKTQIQTSTVTAEQAEVTSGLKAGDKVITEGSQKVRVGMQVNTQPAANAS